MSSAQLRITCYTVIEDVYISNWGCGVWKICTFIIKVSGQVHDGKCWIQWFLPSARSLFALQCLVIVWYFMISSASPQTADAGDVWRHWGAGQCEMGVGSVSSGQLDLLLLLYLEKCQILWKGELQYSVNEVLHLYWIETYIMLVYLTCVLRGSGATDMWKH